MALPFYLFIYLDKTTGQDFHAVIHPITLMIIIIIIITFNSEKVGIAASSLKLPVCCVK